MAKNKYIATPEILWEHFKNYQKWVNENPREIEDYVGNAKKVMRKRPRPLTIEGFENWCADNGIIEDLGDYFSNKNNSYSDYSTICSRIKKTIRQDQIEGGMAGIYNPSITQRLNNLVEKQDVTSAGDKISGTPSVVRVEVVNPDFDD